MPLTGGWWARKSPPRQVSKKWISGESSSPFTFTAPLMPPCAHTECDRFTGTIENRSTGMPASASLIVAMRPARPPPTTATRGAMSATSHDHGAVLDPVRLLEHVHAQTAEAEQ